MFNLTLVVAGLKEFIIDDLSGTVTQATLFFSVETLAYIIFAPIWGLLSDRLGRRKPLVVIGFLGSALAYALYGRIQSIDVLLALRFVQGAFSVMGWSTVMAMMLDHPDRPRQGRYMGLMGASLIFGVALGAPMGGYISRWLGVRAPLAVAATIFLGLSVLAALGLRDSSQLRPQGKLSNVMQALRESPRLLVPMLFHFVDRLAVGLFVVVFPLYLDSLGADDPAIRGRYLALFLLPFAALQYFTGRLAERTGPILPLVVGSLLYGIVLCWVGVSSLTALRPMMVTLGVLAAVMFPPAILLTARWSDRGTRASAMGGFNLAGSLGFTIGPVLGAWAFRNFGFGSAFVICGWLEILVAVVGWLVLRRWSLTESDDS
jgi:DHA1 family tetracycline resistance protein-like MFS transporter